jgi:hypothetical protein
MNLKEVVAVAKREIGGLYDGQAVPTCGWNIFSTTTTSACGR